VIYGLAGLLGGLMVSLHLLIYFNVEVHMELIIALDGVKFVAASLGRSLGQHESGSVR
jgi:hypothetical protein